MDEAHWSGWTIQPPHPNPCGCSTVVICYGVYDTSQEPMYFRDSVNWCPRCEATWTGLEYRRFYGTDDGRFGVE